MKTNAPFQTPFLFNPEMSITGHWPSIPTTKPRKRTLGLALETQIDHKQELICGIILILCLLFALAAFGAQFTLA